MPREHVTRVRCSRLELLVLVSPLTVIFAVWPGLMLRPLGFFVLLRRHGPSAPFRATRRVTNACHRDGQACSVVASVRTSGGATRPSDDRRAGNDEAEAERCGQK